MLYRNLLEVICICYKTKTNSITCYYTIFYVLLVIKPMASHPHTRNIQKHDVVSRGQLYRQSWNCQRAPGEKNHKNLRWNVRGQMLYHDKVVDKVSCLNLNRLLMD